MKFRWQNVAKEDQEFATTAMHRQEKPNTTVQKNTFIDQIFLENTKERYPKPGPGEYFLTEKGVKRFKPDHVDLFEKKAQQDEERKACLPWANK